MHPARRFAPMGLILAGVLALTFIGPSQSEPGSGIQVPTIGEHNEVESRVTANATKNTEQDAKLEDLQKQLDELAAKVTATPTPTPTQTTTPTPTQTTTPTPTQTTTPAPSEWPDASNTGVPSGTSLTTYSGPMTVSTAGTVIDSKTINGTLTINATGVKITKSRVNGRVVVNQAGNLDITDSEIVQPMSMGTGLESYNFTALRIEVTGGNRSIYCANTCTVRDSYVHGQFTDQTGVAHESGIRMEQNGTFIHNTITCDAEFVDGGPNGQTAGCSAALTGYGDFAPVRNNLIQNNYFPAMTNSGGTCAYGGSSAGKPYSGQARDIRFIDNVFGRSSSSERGTSCGYWFTVTDFDGGRPGNVFTGNKYTDGKPVNVNASGG